MKARIKENALYVIVAIVSWFVWGYIYQGCQHERTPRLHAYYVAFNWAGSNGYGWGSRVVASDQKLETEAALKNIADHIRTNNYFTNVGIVSFYELKPQ